MKKQLFATLAFAVMASSAVRADENVKATSPMDGYNPTTVTSEKISEIWKDMRSDYVDGPFCFNRAHVWAYEMRKKNQIQSMKILIHYNDAFRFVMNAPKKKNWYGQPKNKFNWWYHIAPAVQKDDDTVVVLDKAVANPHLGPKSDEQWLGYFENKLETILNNPAKRAKLDAVLEEHRTSRSSSEQYIAERVENLIAKTPIDENGKYVVKCQKINNIVEHDIDKSNWCSSQLASMYYFNQRDLRKLNYNTDRVISNSSQYTQSAADMGSENTYTMFNTYTVLDAYKIGFGKNKRKLKIKDAKDMNRFPQQ